MTTIKKIAKFLGIALLLVLLVFGGLLFYFSKNIKPILVSEINKTLDVKVEVDEFAVSSFLDFPNLGMVLKGVKIEESTKYYQDFLLDAEELALFVDVKKLWKGKYEIDKIELTKGRLNIADLKKSTNYEIIKSSQGQEGGEESAVSFEIKQLKLNDCQLKYNHTPSKYYTKAGIESSTVALKTQGSNTNITIDGLFKSAIIRMANEQYVSDKDLSISSTLVVDAKNEKVTISPTKIMINQVKLAAKGEVDFSKKASMKIEFENDQTTCQSLLSILPASLAKSLDHLAIDGNVKIKGKLEGKNHGKYNPSLNLIFSLGNTSVNGISKGMGISNINGNGTLAMPSIANMKTANVRFKINQAKQENNSINGTLTVKNFNRPAINWDGTAELGIPTIVSLLGTEGVSGAAGNLNVIGKLALVYDVDKGEVQSGSVQFKGDIEGKGIKATFTNPNIDLKQLDINLVATTEDVVIKGAKFAYNGTTGDLKGYIRNFNELGSSNSNATIVGSLTLNNFEVNDFYTTTKEETASDVITSQSNLVPVKFKLKTTLNEFRYNDFEASKISGILSSDKKMVSMKNCLVLALDGETKAEISLRRQKSNFLLDITGNMKNLNIKKMFKQFNNFEQTEITDQHLSGGISGRINTKVLLDPQYEPILSNLYAKADITITNGQLSGYEPLNELSTFVSVSDLQNVKFKTLSNSIEIFDETIHIPKMRIENNALNLEIEGTHTFENYMEYKMSLSVAELLASKANWMAKRKEKRIEKNTTGGLTAYITMTGTPDDLVIKYDKAAAKEKVKTEIAKEKNVIKKVLKGEKVSLKDDEPEKNYKDDVWDE